MVFVIGVEMIVMRSLSASAMSHSCPSSARTSSLHMNMNSINVRKTSISSRCSRIFQSGHRPGSRLSPSSSRHVGSDTRLWYEYDAKALLYQDQQQAMLRRSLFEEELLNRDDNLIMNGDSKTMRVKNELMAPKISAAMLKRAQIKSSGGTGFGTAGSNIKKPKQNNSVIQQQLELLAAEQIKILKKDGVIRINQAIPDGGLVVDDILKYVLDEKEWADDRTRDNPDLAGTFFGVEPSRLYRTDLQLSLVGHEDRYDATGSDTSSGGARTDRIIPCDALQALLGREGTLRALYEGLVGMEGEFYEWAAVITHPGSQRQVVHPDLPFKDTAPLYVMFCALQDVSVDMGPTTFLLGTHTREENSKFNSVDKEVKDNQLRQADCRLSLLKKGDAVVFDARILHCGNANHPLRGGTRALLNLSFRNPLVRGSLGYDGSMRPGYTQAHMTLKDVTDCLARYSTIDSDAYSSDPFAKYGAGLL